MTAENNFVRGKYQTLVATTSIHLGRLERNLSKGDIVEFDGTNIKVGGQEISMPELKAGVKRGWLSFVEPASALPAEPVAEAPARAPAKKDMAVDKIYDEERSVASIKEAVEEAPRKKFAVVVESQDEDIRPVANVETKSGAKVSGATSYGDGIAESQGATAVSEVKIKTASRQKTVITEGTQASAEIARLESITRDGAVTKRAMPVVREQAPSQENEDAVVISKVKSKPLTDADLEDILADEAQFDAPAESDVSDEADFEFDDEPAQTQEQENAEILAAIDGVATSQQGALITGAPSEKVATLASGVDWDMSVHWRKRVASAVERFADHPEVLEEIYAVETQGVVNGIKKSLGV